jgi:broad specificity phosphatase PhoE
LSTKKTIYLIRHGQTDFNRQNIIQGSGIDADLNETGRIQTVLFFEKYANTPFDKVITSQLKRTIQSVEPFINKGIPHLIVPELNEINWGVMEGVEATSEIRKTFREVTKAWADGKLDVSVKFGETPQQLFERQQKVNHLFFDNQAENMLIASHGRAMRSLLCLLTNTSLHRMEKFPHSNLCLYVLEQVDERAFEIITKNDTSHLGDWVTPYDN